MEDIKKAIDKITISIEAVKSRFDYAKPKVNDELEIIKQEIAVLNEKVKAAEHCYEDEKFLNCAVVYAHEINALNTLINVLHAKTQMLVWKEKNTVKH